LGLRVVLVLKDILGNRVQLAEEDLQVQRAQQGQEETQALQGSKVHKANLEMLDQLGPLELVANKVHVVM
jgi:hypothetical protein